MMSGSNLISKDVCDVRSRTVLALRHLPSGLLVRRATDGTTHWLTLDQDAALYEAPSVQAFAEALMTDPPAYNASDTHPSWGDLAPGDLQAEEVTFTESSRPLELPKLRKLHTVELRDLHPLVARQYVGAKLELQPGTPGLVFWLVRVPEGETLDSLRTLEGHVAYGRDRWARRHVYAVRSVPDEYEPLLAGHPGALLIASGLC